VSKGAEEALWGQETIVIERLPKHTTRELYQRVRRRQGEARTSHMEELGGGLNTCGLLTKSRMEAMGPSSRDTRLVRTDLEPRRITKPIMVADLLCATCQNDSSATASECCTLLLLPPLPDVWSHSRLDGLWPVSQSSGVLIANSSSEEEAVLKQPSLRYHSTNTESTSTAATGPQITATMTSWSLPPSPTCGLQTYGRFSTQLMQAGYTCIRTRSVERLPSTGTRDSHSVAFDQPWVVHVGVQNGTVAVRLLVLEGHFAFEMTTKAPTRCENRFDSRRAAEGGDAG
jgi:hypothetical protein